MINFLTKKLKDTNIFITGSGGVGKSYVVRNVIANFRESGKTVVVLGSTGISAVEIGGVTLHSFFRFGINKNFEELKRFDKRQSSKVQELKKILAITDLIVLDEISMVGADVFEMIYYRLANSRFKGHLLVTGDFYQLPPIVRKDEANAPKVQSLLNTSEYAFGAMAWEQMEFFYIEMLGSKRTNDKILYKILFDIRLGNVTLGLLDFISTLIIPRENVDENATIISGRNAEVDAINRAKLDALPSELFTCDGAFETYEMDVSNDKISRWISSLNVPNSLQLKIGAKVLFTANKAGEFYNGEQGVIKEIELNHFGDVDNIVVQKNSGVLVRVERNAYEMSELCSDGTDADEMVLARYYQFPLKLAYAITIHKSQGMSIENLVCDIDHIFAQGQLYVALSRAVSLDGLKVLYSRKETLHAYLSRIIKVDADVVKFYEQNEFMRVINQEI